MDQNTNGNVDDAQAQAAMEEFRTEIRERTANFFRSVRERVLGLEDASIDADLFDFVEVMEALEIDPLEAFVLFEKPTNGLKGKEATWDLGTLVKRESG